MRIFGLDLNKPTGKPPVDHRKNEFLLQYTELIERLSTIRANYDMVTDESTIDALIYEENAVLSKLSGMYRQAREQGITLEYYEHTHESA